MNEQVSDWVSFWDQPHSIYVNARHVDVHYRDIADAIIGFVPRPNAHVMDYACGEAIYAGEVAQHVERLLLCEAGQNVRAKLIQRFRANPKIQVLAPEDLAGLPRESLDLIVANSLMQYLPSEELDRLLGVWCNLLKPDGVLIIGDVIPPDAGAVSDVVALLGYAAKNRFLLAALAGLVRTVASPYRKLRSQIGIACYGEREFLGRLGAAGFTAERLPFNLEHNSKRMSFRATKTAA